MAYLRPSAPLAIALAALPTLLLGACSERRDFPSLAPRPIERADEAAPETPATVQVNADAALDARAAALLDQARRDDAAFGKTANASCPAIARGLAAAEGSEAWIAGQQALSAVEAARGAVTSAVAELDQLTIDNSAATTPVDLTRLLEARRQVGMLDAAERERVATIRAGSCG